jgi:WD40 repeat protein
MSFVQEEKNMPSNAPAVAQRWAFDAPVIGLCANRNGTHVAATLGDGSARVWDASHEKVGQPKHVRLHDGVSLSLKPDADAHAFLSGGDDGRVVILDPVLGETNQIAEHQNQWVDHVAASADGKFRAYSVGKKIYVIDDEGKAKFPEPLVTPSSPGDIEFSPNSKRIAVSHYNGLSLWWMNARDTSAAKMEWKGSHLGIVWSPDGKNVLTSLQENALHGWQVADGKEMRMQGYAAKVRSMAFTPRGKYLATAGADQIVCWPFTGGGPWGKTPLTLGGSDNRIVTMIAPHPKDEMVAAGYGDGMIVLAPLDGRMEVMIHPPTADKGASITGLVWNAGGDALFAATESGTVMLFTIDSVRNALAQPR